MVILYKKHYKLETLQKNTKNKKKMKENLIRLNNMTFSHQF